MVSQRNTSFSLQSFQFVCCKLKMVIGYFVVEMVEFIISYKKIILLGTFEQLF